MCGAGSEGPRSSHDAGSRLLTAAFLGEVVGPPVIHPPSHPEKRSAWVLLVVVYQVVSDDARSQVRQEIGVTQAGCVRKDAPTWLVADLEAHRHMSQALLEADRASSMALPAVEVMGVRFANVVEADAVGHIMSSLQSGRGGFVVTPNVDILRKIADDPELARAVDQADLVIADGMPAVWSSRLQGTPLKARIAFSEMIYPLARAAASQRRSLVLMGGEPGVAERAAEALLRHAPGLRIVATCAPPLGFERNDDEIAALRVLLTKVTPDIVVCALGCPKQERLMARLAPEFPSTWFIGAGGTLTIVSGRTAKAPRWMSRSGLEWFHRLRLEPRRLFRRYVIDDVPFAVRMLAQSAIKRREWRRRPSVPQG